MSGKHKLKICWSCSDFCNHEHRWLWTAWVCGTFQRWAFYLTNKQVCYGYLFKPKKEDRRG